MNSLNGHFYFSLKDDKEVARVRFLFNGIEDVEGFAVHEVEVDGKKRYVNCLREYNQPKDACPFCKANMFTQAKLFIPVYNIDEDKVQLWERGKKFISKISSICARYPNVVAHKFEIERNGKKLGPFLKTSEPLILCYVQHILGQKWAKNSPKMGQNGVILDIFFDHKKM